MKSGIVAVALAGIIVVSGIGYAFLNEPAASAQAQETKGDAKAKSGKARAVVQVDDLAEKPDAYKGEIVLKAAVARVNKANGVFSVIDAREFEMCHEIDCAKHYLPVKYDGKLPETKTEVKITGQVVRTDKGLVFEAKQLDAIK